MECTIGLTVGALQMLLLRPCYTGRLDGSDVHAAFTVTVSLCSFWVIFTMIKIQHI